MIQTRKRKLGKTIPEISLNIQTETHKYPSVNIIGKIEGTDPQLKKEYVLLSGHQDAMASSSCKNDTIYNGDDNASTCVAMLAMARAYKNNHLNAVFYS